MIKSLFAGLWVLSILSGSTYFFFQQASMKADGEHGDKAPKTELMKLDTISVSMFHDESVRGYLVLDVTISLITAVKKTKNVPVDVYLKSELIASILNDKNLDAMNLEKFDLATFRSKLVEDVNASLGFELVEEVLITKMDFLTIDDVRDMKLRRS